MSTATATTSDKQAAQAERPQAERGEDAAFASPHAELLALQASAGNRAVHGLLGGGQPLPPELRAEMEGRFGQDFGQVRLHTGAQAAESAQALAANAYTHGRDIVFGQGRYAPETGAGKRLLAHELAHVVQQSRGGGAPALNPHSALEQAAGRAAEGVAGGGGPVAVQGASGVGVQRDEDESKKRLSSFQGLDLQPGKEVLEFALGRPASEQEVTAFKQRVQASQAAASPTKAAPDKRDSVALIVDSGVSMEASVLKTHWRNRDEMISFMDRYIAYAKGQPERQKQYQEAVAARKRILERPPATLADRPKQPAAPPPAQTAPPAANQEADTAARRAKFEEDLRKSQNVPILLPLFLPTQVAPYYYRDPSREISHPLLKLQAGANRDAAIAHGQLVRRVTQAGLLVYGVACAVTLGSLVLPAAMSIGVEAALGSQVLAPVVTAALANPVTTTAVAEFAAGTVFSIVVAGGIENFLKGLATPEGALNLLYTVLHLRMSIPSSSGGSPRQVTVQGQIEGVSDQNLSVRVTRPPTFVDEPAPATPGAGAPARPAAPSPAAPAGKPSAPPAGRPSAGQTPADEPSGGGGQVINLFGPRGAKGGGPPPSATHQAPAALPPPTRLDDRRPPNQRPPVSPATQQNQKRLEQTPQGAPDNVRKLPVRPRSQPQQQGQQHGAEEEAQEIPQSQSAADQQEAVVDEKLAAGQNIRPGQTVAAAGGQGGRRERRVVRRIGEQKAQTAAVREQNRAGGRRIGLSEGETDKRVEEIANRKNPTSKDQLVEVGHHESVSHNMNKDTMFDTVTNPEVVMVAENGNWVFYKNGSIVVTARGDPTQVQTAFGKGAIVPQRQLRTIREANPGQQIRQGDPEPPVNLNDWIAKNRGGFRVFQVYTNPNPPKKNTEK